MVRDRSVNWQDLTIRFNEVVLWNIFRDVSGALLCREDKDEEWMDNAFFPFIGNIDWFNSRPALIHLFFRLS